MTGVFRRPATTEDPLPRLLRERFRLREFRPHQEAVCRTLSAGSDALLVMPTGAGKSLCYQLPGLARGGTTLVISPLIALMDDQVARLRSLDIAAERIHSGLGRERSREICREYLRGTLDFLYIAPERLAVPGFPEMLARRPPALIAVDEAHCISHWGHDFRPEYRLLGTRLPLLRPAPLVAVTATATLRVQDDILAQLGIPGAERHVHGFRRDNLAVETVELARSQRHERVGAILADAAARPAIVYTPTRREAENLAAALAGQFPASAYHAGLDAADRERVQSAFLAGQLQAVVATIAFGMGVDKADVRTVVHTGLPASVEGYYQEIGRAGRDGRPSRAVLLYAWADLRTHEYFHARSYPEPEILERVHALLRRGGRSAEAVEATLRQTPETVGAALNQLRVHGGARWDGAAWEALAADWQEPYRNQRDERLEQVRGMLRLAESPGCRMLSLVRHFGDQEDSGEPCGICDRCAPGQRIGSRARPADPAERALAAAVLATLGEHDGATAGQLFQAIAGSGPRRDFERILSALATSGAVELEPDSFRRPDGETVHFQRVHLCPGHPHDTVLAGLQLPERGTPGRRRAAALQATGPADPDVLARMREWRSGEARRRGVPAYRILTNRALEQVAAVRPGDRAALARISGIGPVTLEQYGDTIVGLIAGASPRHE